MSKFVSNSDVLLDRCLSLGFVFAIGLFVSVVLLLMNRIPIHSDVLWLEELFQNMKYFGVKDFFNFYTPPAPEIFPDMLIFFVGNLFLNTPAQKIWFLSSIQAVLLVVFSFILLRKLAGRGGVGLASLILIIVSFHVYASTVYDTWSYYHASSIHYGALVFSLLSMYFASRYADSERLSFFVLFFCVNFLCQLSSKAYFAFYIFPVGVVVFISLLFVRKRFLFLLLLSMICSSSFSFLVDKYFLSHALSGLVLNRELLTEQAVAYLKSILFLFNSFDSGTFLLCALFVVPFVGLVIHIFRCVRINPRCSVYFEFDCIFVMFLLFVSCIFFITLVAPNFQARIYGVALYNLRYFNYFFIVSLLLCIYVMLSNYPRFLLFATACLAPVSFCFSLFFLNIYVGEIGASRVPAYVSTMKKMKSELGLKDGIAAFWNARLLEIYFDDGFRVYTVLPPFHPFRNILNTKVHGRSGDYFYNYVIIDKSDTSHEIRESDIPHGYHTVRLTDKITLHYYDDHRLNSFVQRKFLEHMPNDKKLYFSKVDFDMNAIDLPSNVGLIRGQERVASSIQDKAQFIIYGPYSKLPKGKYNATIYFSENTSLASFADVFSLDINPNVLKVAKIAPAESVIELAFTIENDSLPRIEVRVFYDGSGVLAVKRVNIKTVDSH